MAWNPDQPRDEAGKWSSTGGGMVTVKDLRGERGYRTLSTERIAELGPIKTKFDTPDVLEARHYNKQQRDTFQIPREETRVAVAKKLYGKGAERKEREATIILGGPGSGKSFMAKAEVARLGALEIDSDFAKEELPEYNNGKGANAVHNESSDITGRVFMESVKNGDNIVHPAVGRSLEDLQGRIGVLYAAGYKVKLVLVEVDPDEATRRALKRWRDGSVNKKGIREHRFVDPSYIQSVGTLPRQNYEALSRHPAVRQYERWDNNGSKPRFVARGIGPAGSRGVAPARRNRG